MSISWEIVYAIGAVVLGAGLLWGVAQSRNRRPHERWITETASALMRVRPEGFDSVRKPMAATYGQTELVAMLEPEERELSVVITDPALPDNPMIYISSEFERQTGYSAEESLGRNCRFLQGPETDPESIEAIRSALRQQKEITVDVLNYRKDGTEFWNRLRIWPLRDDSGAIKFYAGAQNPIGPEEVRPLAAANGQD